MNVGIAQQGIEPRTPIWLGGYRNRTERSTGVLDRLLVTVLVLEIEDNCICMLCYDIAAIDADVSMQLRVLVHGQYGIPVENVFIETTHNHSGTTIRFLGYEEDCEEGYLEYVIGRSMLAVQEALESKETVRAFFREGEINGFYGNRNDPDGIADKGVRIIDFRDAEGVNKATIINMSCHSTVLGPANSLVSSDLFGYVRDRYEEEFGSKVYMMNATGADLSNRNYRQGADAAELKRIGSGVYEQIRIIEGETELRLDRCVIKQNNQMLHYVPDSEMLDRAYANYIVEQDSPDPDVRKLAISALSARKGLRVDEAKDEMVWAHVLDFGDLALVTVPGEMFSKTGIDIRTASPFPVTLIMGYTNGYVGYMVEEGVYGKYFESFTTQMPKGFPEQFAQGAIDILTHLERD